jgi:outer membrane biogenesis lipoprotein LolB
MSFRLFVLIATIAALLAGCVSTGTGDSLQQIERNHRQALETAG